MKYILLHLCIIFSGLSYAQEENREIVCSSETPCQKNTPATFKGTPLVAKYPAQAARAGITGSVLIFLEIDESGKVIDVILEKSSNHWSLDQAAMKTAHSWKFNPAIINGKPAKDSMSVPVDFTM